ncbi:uncharacterized protein LOC110870132 [Helianthus annuus]|uniref:uncharacterized protein LOC110870132 n=1 Tax=Helianthus annuus TaxID=4232 RepID=UPI000B8F05DD|nr:uncharacterized protein LOC110870132 [Helianthus annuus]
MNTAFFHSSLKARNHISRINAIKDSSGDMYEGEDVPKALVQHYEKFLGCRGDIGSSPKADLFSNTLTSEIANPMVRQVTADEVRKAMFSIVPKIATPSNVTDYRPIACCNVLYKCISKILADRIKGALNTIVNVNQNVGPPRCAFKVDIQKAYDTVDWRFLRDVLLGFGFHDKMVNWIMTCVSTPTFSVCVNGDVHGYFRGLVPSIQKSTIFFCNVPHHVKTAILRYLGVPLISTRLLYKDCSVLVEKLDKRISNWKNKLLSFAGRLQLIVSVLSSMHIYWSSVFILPARVIHDLEARMRNFLWSQDNSFQKGRAKVSWRSVCTPKYKGGLGIRRIGDFNKALMANHVWGILTK